MKLSLLRLCPALKPWLLGALVALPLTSACGDEEAAPVVPPTFALQIIDLEGGNDRELARPRCDGTLAVTVAISPRGSFTLRPPRACGASRACGFVRVEALTTEGELLAQADSVTTTAVLQVAPTRLPELAKVRASLVRGLDGSLVTNPDAAEVTSEVTPVVELPADCEQTGAGGQGGQGAGGQGAGGAPGGADAGGAAGLGGEGGAPSEGGAGGDAG